LRRELAAQSPTASLCYGLMGLAAHGRAPDERLLWLEHAAARVMRQGASPFKQALVALAACDTFFPGRKTS
jgi:hypothetical protein